MILRGAAHRYGDDIDTDVIIPAASLAFGDASMFARLCMTPLDPAFPDRVRRGDIMVAGRNFGCGSSREQAPMALQAAGIAAVVAISVARIFHRNAINRGLPVLVCPEAVAAIGMGEMIAVDPVAETVTLGNRVFNAAPVPPAMRAILDAGGLVPFVRAELARREALIQSAARRSEGQA